MPRTIDRGARPANHFASSHWRRASGRAKKSCPSSRSSSLRSIAASRPLRPSRPNDYTRLHGDTRRAIPPGAAAVAGSRAGRSGARVAHQASDSTRPVCCHFSHAGRACPHAADNSATQARVRRCRAAAPTREWAQDVAARLRNALPSGHRWISAPRRKPPRWPATDRLYGSLPGVAARSTRSKGDRASARGARKHGGPRDRLQRATRSRGRVAERLVAALQQTSSGPPMGVSATACCTSSGWVGPARAPHAVPGASRQLPFAATAIRRGPPRASQGRAPSQGRTPSPRPPTPQARPQAQQAQAPPPPQGQASAHARRAGGGTADRPRDAAGAVERARRPRSARR